MSILPFAPRWSDVQKVLADTFTDAPEDVRDRAILMLYLEIRDRASILRFREEPAFWSKAGLAATGPIESDMHSLSDHSSSGAEVQWRLTPECSRHPD